MGIASHPAAAAGYPPDLVQALLDEARGLRARPPVFAITGLQGSGKSTLAAQLVAAAQARGLCAVALSIDDFYLRRAQRRRLARDVHPLLATRGPPGSHDIAFACDTVDKLLCRDARQEIALPVFDRIADDRLPRRRWRMWRGRADLIVFEGWFLKVPAEDAATLRRPINALERECDPDGRWRRYCNDALGDYAALWSRLDRLLFLRPPGFGVVPGWRWQQEQALQAMHPRRRAMDREQVGRFVQYFERVSRQALRTLPEIAERTIALDRQRRPSPLR